MTTTPRQRRLVDLARRAWPGESLEVVAPEEGRVHVWNERGHAILHCEHHLADAVLALLAGDVALAGAEACLDVADLAIRTRAHRDGIDVIGWREGQIVLWNEGGKIGDGLTLRGAMENLDNRATHERPKLLRSERTDKP